MNSITYGILADPQDSEVLIGQNLFGTLAARLAGAFSRAVLITEDKLLPLWGDALDAALSAAGLSVLTLTVPSGEESKTRETKAALEDRMIAAGIDRSAVVIALGGGMICDLAAFTAATYMRGLSFVLVPTTTLAMADAAIGGKCAVNTPAGKNLVGAFALPVLTLIDTDTLSTLPGREYREGLAEMLKLGFVANAEVLSLFETLGDALLERDPAVLCKLLALSVETKIRLVAGDFRDTRGQRALLNYGHTYGHAIEALSGYRYLHGEAVALGMRLAAAKAVEEGLCSAEWAKRQNDFLDLLGMPAMAELPYSEAELNAAAAHDKKSQAGKLHFVLSKGPGEGILF